MRPWQGRRCTIGRVRAGSSKARAIAVTFTFGVAIAALGISAAAASATNCPYISASKLAKAFGLQHATAFLVEGPEQPQYAAYRSSLCRAVAWSGSTPANEAQAQAKINSGKAAAIVIKTAEETTGTPEEIEAWHKDFETQTEGFHVAGQLLGHAFHGKTFAPPAFGAPSELGYEGVQKGRLGIYGIWESDSQHDYLTILITEAKGKPGRKSLEKIAAVAVTGFGV
jgi:hypothetical protein